MTIADIALLSRAPGARRAGLIQLTLLGAMLFYAALLYVGWWGLAHLVPDQFSFHLLRHAFAFHDLHQKVLANAALILAILPAALWLECALIGWERSSCRALLSPSASAKTDLACFVLEQMHIMGLLGRVMMLGASILSGLWLRDWLAAKTGFVIPFTHLPLVLQVVIYFYIYSFFDYWTHRVGHTRLFWPLHRYHHAAEEFCMVNAGRAHPANLAGVFLLNIPMPLLGASPEAMLWVNAITILFGFLTHSRIESGLGWVGRYVIQSPLHHRLHHKLDMREATGFFGMAPVWDHLFGGWSERRDHNIAIGVDTPYRHGFWILPDLLRDYWDFWKGFAGRRNYSPSER